MVIFIGHVDLKWFGRINDLFLKSIEGVKVNYGFLIYAYMIIESYMYIFWVIELSARLK